MDEAAARRQRKGPGRSVGGDLSNVARCLLMNTSGSTPLSIRGRCADQVVLLPWQDAEAAAPAGPQRAAHGPCWHGQVPRHRETQGGSGRQRGGGHAGARVLQAQAQAAVQQQAGWWPLGGGRCVTSSFRPRTRAQQPRQPSLRSTSDTARKVGGSCTRSQVGLVPP
jgi:hypothetical protein